MTLEILDIAIEFFDAFGVDVEEEEVAEEEDLYVVDSKEAAATATEAALVDIVLGWVSFEIRNCD